jgi:hypothetical protein
VVVVVLVETAMLIMLLLEPLIQVVVEVEILEIQRVSQEKQAAPV